jgi:hypothetical protein
MRRYTFLLRISQDDAATMRGHLLNPVTGQQIPVQDGVELWGVIRGWMADAPGHWAGHGSVASGSPAEEIDNPAPRSPAGDGHYSGG